MIAGEALRDADIPVQYAFYLWFEVIGKGIVVPGR